MMTEDQIKHMVDRFLSWKLPEHFNPDGGISFDPVRNPGSQYEERRQPVGTNLFDATQACEMVLYMLDGLAPPAAANPSVAEGLSETEVVRLFVRYVHAVVDPLKPGQSLQPAGAAATNGLISVLREADAMLATFPQPSPVGRDAVEGEVTDGVFSYPSQSGPFEMPDVPLQSSLDEVIEAALRLETEAEHIARDLKSGRFPERSERLMIPDIQDAWTRIGNDHQLDIARKKLSMHELRRIIKHAEEAFSAIRSIKEGEAK